MPLFIREKTLFFSLAYRVLDPKNISNLKKKEFDKERSNAIPARKKTFSLFFRVSDHHR